MLSLVPICLECAASRVPDPRSKTEEPRPKTQNQRYNIRVPSPEPQNDEHKHDEHKHHRHAVYASETTGLLLIAFLLLILTLIRYWHDIHWSWR